MGWRNVAMKNPSQGTCGPKLTVHLFFFIPKIISNLKPSRCRQTIYVFIIIVATLLWGAQIGRNAKFLLILQCKRAPDPKIEGIRVL